MISFSQAHNDPDRHEGPKHRHRPASSRVMGFTGPVSADENRAAHGNVCLVETCKCGDVRRTNVNGRHREVGKWGSK